MNLGYTFVLAVRVLAILCWRAGAPRGFALLTILWGFVVAWLGMTQTRLVPGPSHWTIQVAHLAVGIVAMGFAGTLSRRVDSVGADVRGRQAPSAARSLS